MTSLLVLKQLCQDPNIILEIFLNYDCQERSQANTFEKMASTLEKVVQGAYFSHSSMLTESEENRLKAVGLEALVDTMKSLVAWTDRAEEAEKRRIQQETAAAASIESIAAASSSSLTLNGSTSGAMRASPSPTPSTAQDADGNESRSNRSSPHGRDDTYVSAASSSSSSVDILVKFPIRSSKEVEIRQWHFEIQHGLAVERIAIFVRSRLVEENR